MHRAHMPLLEHCRQNSLQAESKCKASAHCHVLPKFQKTRVLHVGIGSDEVELLVGEGPFLDCFQNVLERLDGYDA
jgi:hypothetical protein